MRMQCVLHSWYLLISDTDTSDSCWIINNIYRTVANNFDPQLHTHSFILNDNILIDWSVECSNLLVVFQDVVYFPFHYSLYPKVWIFYSVAYKYN